MGKRTSYEPGTFSWIELSTTEPEAAKEFYGGLFGWQADDQPLPDGGVYSMMQIDGERVAAIAAQMDDQRAAGVPPNWFSYVTVASADDAAKRASELGGSVHAGPFDVMEAGRMAVVGDPTGAMFGIWQAGESIGATLVNDPGALTMNELSTNEPQKAMPFYEGLFGWRFDSLDVGDLPPYWGSTTTVPRTARTAACANWRPSRPRPASRLTGCRTSRRRRSTTPWRRPGSWAVGSSLLHSTSRPAGSPCCTILRALRSRSSRARSTNRRVVSRARRRALSRPGSLESVARARRPP